MLLLSVLINQLIFAIPWLHHIFVSSLSFIPNLVQILCLLTSWCCLNISSSKFSLPFVSVLPSICSFFSSESDLSHLGTKYCALSFVISFFSRNIQADFLVMDWLDLLAFLKLSSLLTNQLAWKHQFLVFTLMGPFSHL